MNRVLLLGINARYTHSNPALLYLKRSIEDIDLQTSVIEFTISEGAGKILDEVKRLNPDLLAVSVYIWNAFLVKKILPGIKSSLPEIKIVLGGPEVSYNAEEWIDEFSEIDCIITGGGEAAFRDLVISGFDIKRKITKGLNPHFSLIRFPYTREDMISLKGRYVYYESSRGCPFNCSYCLSSVKEQNVEFRKTDQVADELDFFSSYNPPLVKFVDRTFNLKKDHYIKVWEHIVKKFSGSGTCFHFEIFPELLDDEDLRFLSEVPKGLFQFEMGIQSANLETLKEINRSGSWAKLENNIRKLAETGNIHLHTDLIAGLPYEGFAGFSESFNKVYSLGAEHFQVGFLKVLPGTEMHSKAEEYTMEYSSLPPYEIIGNRWTTPEEMDRLKIIAELVDLMHNSGRFQETEKFMVSLYGAPFLFFNRYADFFRRVVDASHRKWVYQCEVLLSMTKTDHPERVMFLTDCLRWDWCTAMKHHHLPDILKSESTVSAKRKGCRFFLNFSKSKIVHYGEESFPEADLRRSIFFSAETKEFIEYKMKDKMALFLPEKKIIYFNPD
jgi:sulfatase maturation enzyme AslB (radical SAM superfamily)